MPFYERQGQDRSAARRLRSYSSLFVVFNVVASEVKEWMRKNGLAALLSHAMSHAGPPLSSMVEKSLISQSWSHFCFCSSSSALQLKLATDKRLKSTTSDDSISGTSLQHS